MWIERAYLISIGHIILYFRLIFTIEWITCMKNITLTPLSSSNINWEDIRVLGKGMGWIFLLSQALYTQCHLTNLLFLIDNNSSFIYGINNFLIKILKKVPQFNQDLIFIMIILSENCIWLLVLVYVISETLNIPKCLNYWV